MAPFPHFGETMALTAAMIFAWTSLFFTSAGRRLGVTTVNLLRLPGAVLCLGTTHYVLNGRLWPEGLAPIDQLWIALSGVVGLAIGDSALFKAFTLVGPRRSMTMMALAPVFTAVFAWLVLDERLGLLALGGIAVAITGVILAILGGGGGSGIFGNLSPAVRRRGALLAGIGAMGQGLGVVFAKMGMTGSDLDPLGTTLVRLAWAAVAFWVVIVPRLDVAGTRRRLRDHRGVLTLVAAILLGPFISVWISIVAIRHTEAGIAQTLLGMVPVFVMLPAWLVHRDRPTPLSFLGILVAVAGGALLFVR
jgi:drug/metabolite transporter (DMT)-like permease